MLLINIIIYYYLRLVYRPNSRNNQAPRIPKIPAKQAWLLGL